MSVEASMLKTIIKSRVTESKVFCMRASAKLVGLLANSSGSARLKKWGLLSVPQSDGANLLRDPADISDPEQLFDEEFYRSQCKESPTSHLTLLEHYITKGAQAGLDPSPFFSTKFYLESYPDIKKAGANPLLHYIKWGVNEGREAFLLNARELKQRVAYVLDKNDQNVFGLAYLAVDLSLRNDFKQALHLFRRTRKYLPLPFYLKMCGLCFFIAGRFVAAEMVFARLNQLAGILDGKNLFFNALVTAGVLVRERGDIASARRIYLQAIKSKHQSVPDALYDFGLFCINKEQIHVAADLITQSLKMRGKQEPDKDQMRMLYDLGVLCFSKGQIGIATDLITQRRSMQSLPELEITQMRMLSVKSHCDATKDSYHEIYPERAIEEIKLKFLNGTPKLSSQAGDLSAPPFYLALLKNCQAFSTCNVIVNNRHLITDAVSHDVFPRAVMGDAYEDQRIIASRYQDQALVQLPDVKPALLEKGLMMFGLQSGNYGHWFLEYLPRMLAFDSELCSEEYPLVVDANMPPAHLESLQLLNTRKRPVVTLPPNHAVAFSKLGVAPVPAYFPLDVNEGVAYDTVWPRDIFCNLKKRIIESLEKENFPFSMTRRPLFISRKNFSARQLVNETEVETFLHSRGFITIYPETMTFAEQVDAFQSASMIVGSCSSALTNAIFCKPGTRVVGLINECSDFNFRGYTSFIEAGGAEVIFIQGKACSEQTTLHRFHENYTISIHDVMRAID